MEEEYQKPILSTRDKVFLGLGFTGGVVFTVFLHRRTHIRVSEVNHCLREMFELDELRGTGEHIDSVLKFVRK